MSLSTAQTWLPDSAIFGTSTIAPLAEAVESWGSQWLSDGRLSVLEGWRKLLGPVPDLRLTVGEGCAILCPSESKMELASLLLGSDVSERRLRTVQDRTVIDELLEAALASLAAILRGAHLAANLREEGPYYALDFGRSPTEPVFAIICSLGKLTDLARLQARPKREGPPTETLASAISDQFVSVGARLGNSRLTLVEIEALDVGDIIVLDQGTRIPVDLMIGGGNAVQSAAMVSSGTQKLTLVIERSTDKW